MIPFFFTNLPVTLASKLEVFLKRVLEEYGSEYYNVQGQYWTGDKLTVESLFPDYILKEYNTYPSKVLIIPLVKNYLRWLFSMEYGYGAHVQWENIRTGLLMDRKILEGLAEEYFPGEDFASSDLSDVLPNIRKFSLFAEQNYLRVKGTNRAIRYVLVELLGLPYNTTAVITYSNNVIKIYGTVPDKYKNYLNRNVYPAGKSIIYEDV